MENTSVTSTESTYQFPVNKDGNNHAEMFGITEERAKSMNDEFQKALDKLGETEDPNVGTSSKEMIVAMAKYIKSENEALAGAFFLGTAIAKMRYGARRNPLETLMQMMGD